jgi:hypothetical protein
MFTCIETDVGESGLRAMPVGEVTPATPGPQTAQNG